MNTRTSMRAMAALIVASSAFAHGNEGQAAKPKNWPRTPVIAAAAMTVVPVAFALVAHLKTRRVLSDDQVTACNAARGYSGGSATHKHRH